VPNRDTIKILTDKLAELVGVLQTEISLWIAGKRITGKEHLRILTNKLTEIEIEAASGDSEEIIL